MSDREIRRLEMLLADSPEDPQLWMVYLPLLQRHGRHLVHELYTTTTDPRYHWVDRNKAKDASHRLVNIVTCFGWIFVKVSAEFGAIEPTPPRKLHVLGWCSTPPKNLTRAQQEEKGWNWVDKYTAAAMLRSGKLCQQCLVKLLDPHMDFILTLQEIAARRKHWRRQFEKTHSIKQGEPPWTSKR